MKFYRNEGIEEIAEQRLHEFERKLERPLSFPLDIELFGDLVLGLSMLWEEIEEIPGEEVLAGLRAPDRLIVMNERRKQEMEQQPGRRRLTQGHEMAAPKISSINSLRWCKFSSLIWTNKLPLGASSSRARTSRSRR
jgi:hypothetical protein